jgi:hypothetical protein
MSFFLMHDSPPCQKISLIRHGLGTPDHIYAAEGQLYQMVQYNIYVHI